MDNMFLLICGMTIWTAIVACFLHLLRKRKSDLKWIGMNGILAIYLLCFFRSIQLSDFNKSSPVFMPEFFSSFYKAVVLKKYRLSFFVFSIEQLFYAIWLFVALICIVRLLYHYCKVRKIIAQYPICEDKQVLDALENAKNICNKKCEISIRKWEKCPIPAVFGFRRKNILLPQKKYSDTELTYVLVHEMTHIFNYDLQINMILQIWIRIFWWNPVFHILARDLAELIELRCDMCVVRQMNCIQRADYLTALVSAMQYAKNYAGPTDFMSVSFILSSSDDSILERFQMVSNENTVSKMKTGNSLFLIVAIISFCLLSYCFMPMSFFEPPIDEIECDGSVLVTQEELYILHRLDNNYYPVYNGQVCNQLIDDESLADFIANGYQIIEETDKEVKW